jgi:hypothetical protein
MGEERNTRFLKENTMESKKLLDLEEDGRKINMVLQMWGPATRIP